VLCEPETNFDFFKRKAKQSGSFAPISKKRVYLTKKNSRAARPGGTVTKKPSVEKGIRCLPLTFAVTM
jgi:hypothetical protein